MISIKRYFHSLRQLLSAPAFSPFSLTLATGLIAFFYALCEWVFIITRPSSLTAIPFAEQILLLCNFSAILIVVSIILLIPIWIYTWIAKKEPRPVFLVFFALIPTIILATLALMLVDNFTYTVFHFGIVTTKGISRGIYTLFYLVGLLFLYKPTLSFIQFIEEVRTARPKGCRIFSITAFAVLLVCGFIIPVLLNSGSVKALTLDSEYTSSNGKPNVLLITADGLNATDMSLYGSKSNTTPFLKELAASSLVAENAFSNAQGTIGSVSSILTGKYPIELRVIYSTDILKGINTLQHLPGILKNRGYYTVQLSYSYYADAGTVNLVNGFDEANTQGSHKSSRLLANIIQIFPPEFGAFLRETGSRPLERLGHIFFLRDMSNPYKQVTEGVVKVSDQEKIDRTITLLQDSSQPVFIHLHWMGTHGPKYYPQNQVFSTGRNPETQGKYEDDFYFDSILEFDQSLKRLFQSLEEQGLLENTVIVIMADHSQNWTNARVPLLIHFPGNEFSRVISKNVQYLSVSPTLLDYLGIPQPSWMPGNTLLQGVEENDPIFIAKIPRSTKDKITGKVIYPKSQPPFYQFGRISVVLCDKWYELDLNYLKMTDGKIKEYVGDCSGETSTPQQALDLISAHLEEYGFDTATLNQVTFE